MIDVRLAATNPEDSTLVPVSCNARGELATVAPKIQEIPNDLKIDGDLTVTGLINGSDGVGEPGPPGPPGEPGGQGPQGEQGDPGVGVPLPYGEEGSYLGIIDGIPQWNIPVGPGPGPEPEPDIICESLFNKRVIRDASDNDIQPPDPYEFVLQQATWGNENAQSKEGCAEIRGDNWQDFTIDETFTLENSFGKVLTISYEQYWVAQTSRTFNPPTVSTDNENAVLVSNSFPSLVGEEGRAYWRGGTIQFLLNRELAELNIQTTFVPAHMKDQRYYIRHFSLIDSGTVALNRQLEVERQLKALYGMTTSIDLSRPTQD